MHLYKTGKLALLTLTLVGGTAAADPSLSIFTPTDDAMIFGTSATPPVDTGNASGMGPGMFAGADGGSSRKRSLVKFDLGTVADSGSLGMDEDPGDPITDADTIVEVDLMLVIGQIAGSGGGDMMGWMDPPHMGGGGCGTSCSPSSRTFSLYQVTTDWNEGSTGLTCSGMTCQSMSGTGQGWTHTSGDVTWADAVYSGTGWTNGPNDQDYSSAINSTTFTDFTFQLGMDWVGSGTTDPLVETVQAWANNSATNFGLEVKTSLETTATSFIGWWTKDGAAANSNMQAAPHLYVYYNP